MALISCPECKREISEQAPACSGCGYVLRRAKAHVINRGIGCAPVLLALLGFCLLFAFPIGTILAFLIWIWAGVLGNKPKRFCSRCTKPVGKGEWSCPHCQAEFEDFKGV